MGKKNKSFIKYKIDEDFGATIRSRYTMSMDDIKYSNHETGPH